MRNTPQPVLIAGSLTRDRIFSPGGEIERPGGVVWYAALALADLGLPVRIATRTAPQDRVLLDPLIEAGVEVFWEPSGSTTTLVLHYEPGNPSRRRIQVESLADAVRGACLAAALRGAGLLYLGPIHPHDLDMDCLPAIQGHAPARVALDGQGFLRRHDAGWLLPGRDPVFADWLEVAGLLKLSEEEARTALDEFDLPAEALADALARRLGDREIVLTCGARGAWIRDAGVLSHAPARPVTADPTGAGDLFLAAYLSRRQAGAPGQAAAVFATAYVEKRLVGRAERFG